MRQVGTICSSSRWPHSSLAVAGFIALAYEIVWYRLFSYWSGSNARVFATVLGIYLTGIAVGRTNRPRSDQRKRGQKRNTGQYLRLRCMPGRAGGNLGRLRGGSGDAVWLAHYNAALLIVALAAAIT